MKTPRTSWLKAFVTVTVYGIIGAIFIEDYPGISVLFGGLCVLRLVLLTREVRRNASLPEPGSFRSLDSSQ